MACSVCGDATPPIRARISRPRGSYTSASMQPATRRPGTTSSGRSVASLAVLASRSVDWHAHQRTAAVLTHRRRLPLPLRPRVTLKNELERSLMTCLGCCSLLLQQLLLIVLVCSTVPEYVFYVFFENPKTRLFTFYEVAFKKT